MIVDEKVEKDKLILFVKGRLDTTTAPQLEEILAGKTTGLAELILDFSELEYISSAGLRVLLATHKIMCRQNGGLTIRGVNDEVMEVLHITGFLDILNVKKGGRQ